MSCERHNFLDTDDRVFCTVCGDPPTAEQLEKIMSNRNDSPSEDTRAMTCAEKERLFDLRCRSKRGEYISPEDFKFLEHCWKTWPIEYSLLQGKVFEATKPFGSK